jgi:hypothetical protein
VPFFVTIVFGFWSIVWTYWKCVFQSLREAKLSSRSPGAEILEPHQSTRVLCQNRVAAKGCLSFLAFFFALQA